MHSLLNPDAPEFHPNFASVTKRGYEILSKTVRISNKFPTGQSANMCKTSADFISVTFQLRESVVNKKNMILQTEQTDAELKVNDNEYNVEKIVQVNDSILEKININMESISNIIEASNDECENITNESTQNIAPTKTQGVPPADANIPHPQKAFKDQVDNSYNIWVPKISDKPNSIKPLALNILYNMKGKIVGYEHPYKTELNMYHPPSFIFGDRTSPRFPKSFEYTPFTYIDTESQVDVLVNHLNVVNELAVDVEHHSLRTFQGITCLIQISTSGGDFIIDALAVREHLHKLNLSFTDPRKIKVLHGAKMDVLWLQRDFGVYIVGLFDTYEAAKTLNMPDRSLKGLLEHYCGINVDKRYQLADWRIRPLPEEMINYARSDTHYLLYIWRMMKNELLWASGDNKVLLLSVFEQGRHICEATYNKEYFDDTTYLDLYLRSKKKFDTQQLVAFKMLYKWRDTQARKLDESLEYLLPNHMLIALAERLPCSVSDLHECCKPVPPFVKQNVIELIQLMLTCRGLPLKPQLYPMPEDIPDIVEPEPIPSKVHDRIQFTEYSETTTIAQKKHGSNKNGKSYNTDIKSFKKPSKGDPKRNAALNADAKLFVPPYERFKKYRELAQIEEVKEFKKKEAEIVEINKENNSMTNNTLVSQQEQKTDATRSMADVVKDKTIKASKMEKPSGSGIAKEAVKNKSSTFKKNFEHPGTSKETSDASKVNTSSPNALKNKFKTDETHFNYKNVNYNKFNYAQKFNNCQKSSKQAKAKNKNK